MFTWFMNPNQPQWFLDPMSNLEDLVEGMARSVLRHGETTCLTGCCLH